MNPCLVLGFGDTRRRHAISPRIFRPLPGSRHSKFKGHDSACNLIICVDTGGDSSIIQGVSPKIQIIHVLVSKQSYMRPSGDVFGVVGARTAREPSCTRWRARTRRLPGWHGTGRVSKIAVRLADSPTYLEYRMSPGAGNPTIRNPQMSVLGSLE